MIPVKFPQANKTYTAPAGMTAEQCGDLPVYQGVDGSGRPVIVSCFELSQEELAEVNRTGRVWLWVTGSVQPPVAVDVKDPWRQE